MTDFHAAAGGEGGSLFLPSGSVQHRLDTDRNCYHAQYHGCHGPLAPLHNQQPHQDCALLHTSTLDMDTLDTVPLASLPAQYCSSAENYAPWIYNHHTTEPDLDSSWRMHIAPLESQRLSGEMKHSEFTNHTVQGTLEPRMMLRRYGSLSLDNHASMDMLATDCAYESSMLDYNSPPYYSATYLEQTVVSDDDTSPTLTEATLNSPPCKTTDDDEDLTDKPYARLIYEALMQAPGHRMMLKDIYEWFIKNTNKPQESGTNGWQNSIRHNLSMNQAFENDKSSCPSTRSHSRKANSVWILTADAVQHGVQSTTRYRKPCNIKRGVSSRSPAIQRQKSGARGGRAARKSAARLRRQEDMPKLAQVHPSDAATPCPYLGSMNFDEDMFRQALQQDNVPATPADEGEFRPLYALPAGPSAFHVEQAFKAEHEDVFEPDSYMHDYFFQSNGIPNFDEVSKIETD